MPTTGEASSSTCNREAKEHWFLENHPKRSESGVRVHTYFVFACMALVAGFRAYKAKADEAKQRGRETGIHRYRRRLEMENRDKVAVFIGDHFGIFRSFEFALLGGMRVREREIMGETPQTVLRRYGAHIPESHGQAEPRDLLPEDQATPTSNTTSRVGPRRAKG